VSNTAPIRRARRVKLRMATERLRRLYDRVTGGLHPYLVLLMGECLCVVLCASSSIGGMDQKAKRRNAEDS
jgi:hypothetical protein